MNYHRKINKMEKEEYRYQRQGKDGKTKKDSPQLTCYELDHYLDYLLVIDLYIHFVNR